MMSSVPLKAERSASGLNLGTLCARVAVALIAVASLVILSTFFDARLAIAAEALPKQAVLWGLFISYIGRSRYMFGITAVLTVGALAARQLLRTRRFDLALTLLAERSFYLFVTLAVSGLTAQVIKHLVGRARPKLFAAFGPYHFDLLSMTNALASFPSGHATTAFAMAVALTMIVPSLRVAFFTLAVAIATSRIVVEAHFLSDIAAGSALGIASALLIARAFADRAIAFTRIGGSIVLKGPGLIAATMAKGRITDP